MSGTAVSILPVAPPSKLIIGTSDIQSSYSGGIITKKYLAPGGVELTTVLPGFLGSSKM